MNNIGGRCVERPLLSRKINDAIRATEHPGGRNELSRKAERVSRAINRRGRRSRAIDLRQNDARRPWSARPTQRERKERRTGVPGVGQVNQKIARHTQNSAAQWNLNSARAVELNSLQTPPPPLSLSPHTLVISLPSSLSRPRRVLFSLFRN